MENVEPLKQIITDKDIWNRNFPSGISGVYCFKEDASSIMYAYLSVNLDYVIIISNSNYNEWHKYSWEDYSQGNPECGRIKLLKFMDELSCRHLMMKGNTNNNKNDTYWRVYSPQENTPLHLVSFIEKLKEKGKI